MRIVIDLQGAQSTGSRNRGIGRYSLSLAQGIARHQGAHEVLIALTGLFPETIDPICSAFAGLLPRENIRVWVAPAPLGRIDAGNDWRREAAERLREAFLSSLKPDVILISSLFEGLEDDAVTSIGKLGNNPPTAVVLYDLIPWIHRKPYLDNPDVRNWYEEKIGYLRQAQLWLSISESSRQEGLRHLNLPEDAVVNISTAADAQFGCKDIAEPLANELRRKYGLTRPFLMYTGGIDHRKNIKGLIRAYATLPVAVRKAHQLAIVCSVQTESRKALEQLATHCVLASDEVVLTGFVPEGDLIALYRLCKAFVFPSWHEGFGLPALEAMHCGAPVIAANTSSLPEVLGHDEALFDPFDEQAIASKIMQVLDDEAFRQRLISHGLQQAHKFSWDSTAKRAIAAFEQMHTARSAAGTTPAAPAARPKLAYISPLPPERSGIADYSADLLPALAQYYDIEVIVAQKEISDTWLKTNFPVRTVEWFRKNGAAYQRVLYHFGNSTFHEHMFDLLGNYPGVVVLHDFFLSGIQAHREVYGHAPSAWSKALYKSHGYPALHHRFHVDDMADVISKYPANFGVLQRATGVIVHSRHSIVLADQWYGAGMADAWAEIPLLRTPADLGNRAQMRQRLGFTDNDFVVASFGLLGSTKLNHELLDAWLACTLARDENCHLVFVGENDGGDYGARLLKTIARSGHSSRIHITGWTDAATFKSYLTACDIGVQLRTLSRGETSAAVLDCMNYGLPTIVNANGSMADLDGHAVVMLPDRFTTAELQAALESLWRDERSRTELGQHAKESISRTHAPSVCARQYHEAIENFYLQDSCGERFLIQAIAGATHQPPADNDLVALASAIAQDMLQQQPARQLLVDISGLVQGDASTVIQRTTKNILKHFLEKPVAGYRVEPVYATMDHDYRYARQFTLGLIDCPTNILDDAPMDAQAGDILLVLDFQPRLALTHRASYRRLRWHGVKVAFVVYDLSPYMHPQLIDSADINLSSRWLEVVANSDAAICVSRAVADELSVWLATNHPPREEPLKISWFHLGADTHNLTPTKGMPNDADPFLRNIKNRTSYLMIEAIEPRNGHAQVLGAFEQLWAKDVDANLVIVGKQGCMVEPLIERLRHHDELNKRLFWLEGVSDEYLEKIYAASACLIVASDGKDFGVPLIEAAQHTLPVIARDIPVFREVAGNHAFYFSGLETEDLSQAVHDWLEQHKRGSAPSSVGMSWQTWEQSAQQLLHAVFHAEESSAHTITNRP